MICWCGNLILYTNKLCNREVLFSLIYTLQYGFLVTGSIHKYCIVVTELCLQSQTGVRMIATEQDSEHSILVH